MIDAHIHAVNPQLPGSKSLPSFLDGQPEQIASVLSQQMRESGTQILLGMGHMFGADNDPLGVDSTLRVADLVPGLQAIGIADPSRIDADHLQNVERQLQSTRVKALKSYLGYSYYGPNSPNYVPYYELAARYEIPFIFHTGDNHSTLAKVKYAHPLLVDEVAVEHRNVNFVIAHFGNPWIIDAAEVVFKNENVWADLSGLLVGDEAYFRNASERGVLLRLIERVKQGIEFTDRPDKFLYGTDWPLAPMRVYREVVERIIPEEYHDAVFYQNANALFKLGVVT